MMKKKKMERDDDLVEIIKETKETKRFLSRKAKEFEHCTYCGNAGYGCPTGGCWCENCIAYQPDWESDMAYCKAMEAEADKFLRRLSTKATACFPKYGERVKKAAFRFNREIARSL